MLEGEIDYRKGVHLLLLKAMIMAFVEVETTTFDGHELGL